MQHINLLCIILLILPLYVLTEDYYEILGIPRDADDRTIRKAFKKIAIQKHPDKNQDNPNAHDEFVKINKAYEILKDEELRKKYDQYGEEGLKDDFQGGNQYQSWQFYKDNFGIYDDDVEIVTLSRADFQQTVIDSGDLWFINFYSTYCSHCHELAPTVSLIYISNLLLYIEYYSGENSREKWKVQSELVLLIVQKIQCCVNRIMLWVILALSYSPIVTEYSIKDQES